MRSSKVLLALCAAVALVATSFTTAGAFITGSTGSVIRVSPAPPSVKLNALQSATSVQVFDEKQGVTLTAGVAVDIVNPGTYSTYPAGSFSIHSGTVVDSHLIHSDAPSGTFTSRRQGSVTFSDVVLGLVVTTSHLTSTDGLGATGTQYASGLSLRGLENTEDKVTISPDRKTVTFDVQTATVMDEIRVITQHRAPLVTTVTDSPDPVQVGGNVTYVAKVTNTGNVSATGVTLTDQFPGATFVSATAPGGCSGTTTVTCTLGTIAAGGFATATIVVRAPATVPSGGTITNTANSPQGQGPATATTTVVSPSLTTTITDSPDPVTTGNDVQYTLTVKNTGVGSVATALVYNGSPAGTTFVSASAPGGCLGSDSLVLCSVGALAPGASAQAKIVVTTPNAVGTITDSAVATPGSNATTTETTSVVESAPGEASGFVSPSGSITTGGDNPATVTLPNSGPGAPIIITQGTGTFCDGPCVDPTTTISSFPGYDDPNNPITVTLEFHFTAIGDAFSAFSTPVYKITDENPLGVVVPDCASPGAGIANPHPCVDFKGVADNSHIVESSIVHDYVLTYKIVYISGDPSFGKRR